MKTSFVTTKTTIFAILLVLLVCCLAVSLALSFNAQAEAPVAIVDELPASSSSDNGIMPLSAQTVNDAESFVSAWNNPECDSITLSGNVTLDEEGGLEHLSRVLTLNLGSYTLNLNGKYRDYVPNKPNVNNTNVIYIEADGD